MSKLIQNNKYMKTAHSKNQKGFTLIELLVVIGILAVLLSITLIAINPNRQFAQANNTKRRSDVNAVLNSVGQYMADNSGSVPAGIDTTVRYVSNDTGVTSRVDLCTVLMPTYLAQLPVDPQTNNGAPVATCTATYNTGYTVVMSNGNRITVAAPAAQESQTISVTR